MLINRKDYAPCTIIYFTFALILLYAVQDFRTSGNIHAFTDANRYGVHAALLIIIVYLGIFFVFTTMFGRILKSEIKLALWFITGWMVFVNYSQGGDFWFTATHVGLSTLWVLVYHFFSYILRWKSRVWPYMCYGIGTMFGFYVFSNFYASLAFQAFLGRVFQLNVVYYVIALLPWIMLWRKKARRIGLGLVIFLVFLSMKRGALIVFPLMWIVSLLVEAKIKKTGYKLALKLIFFIVVFISCFLITDHLVGGFLAHRFSGAEIASPSSGRMFLYTESLEDILQRSGVDLWLGRGSGSTVKFLGTAAHSDWLEFLFNFGIIGVVFYALFLLSLVRKAVWLVKRSSPYASAYSMAVTFICIVGLYGMIYFAHWTLYVIAFLGAVEGLEFNNSRYVRDSR